MPQPHCAPLSPAPTRWAMPLPPLSNLPLRPPLARLLQLPPPPLPIGRVNRRLHLCRSFFWNPRELSRTFPVRLFNGAQMGPKFFQGRKTTVNPRLGRTHVGDYVLFFRHGISSQSTSGVTIAGTALPAFIRIRARCIRLFGFARCLTFQLSKYSIP